MDMATVMGIMDIAMEDMDIATEDMDTVMVGFHKNRLFLNVFKVCLLIQVCASTGLNSEILWAYFGTNVMNRQNWFLINCTYVCCTMLIV